MGPARVIVDQTTKAPDCCDREGNPIQPSIGNKILIETDYVGQGPFPLVFRRTYNSAPTLGAGWRHTYDRSLVIGYLEAGSGNKRAARLSRHDGSVRTLLGFYTDFVSSNPDYKDSMTGPDWSGSGGWFYKSTNDDELESYSGSGRLLSIKNRAGLQQTTTYDGNGRLAVVTDPLGHTLQFAYDANGRMATMTDPGGGVYIYGYDTNGNLTSVHYPDGKAKTYLYENTAFPRALTGIVDENGVRYATYGYDANGLAVLSEHAGGADRVTVIYGTPPTIQSAEVFDSSINMRRLTTSFVAPSGITVTNALGNTQSIGYQSVFGMPRRASNSGPGCTSCGTTSAKIFDANGNVASVQDFNGNLTTYSYDLSRNLETSRTEAYGTPSARTITTQWHATFRLPIKITEPGRVTDLTYDTTGNLTSYSRNLCMTCSEEAAYS